MAREYSMTLHLTDCNEKEYQTIKKVFEKEWKLDHDDFENRWMWGDDILVASDDEDIFFSRLCNSIWKQLGYYKQLSLTAKNHDYPEDEEIHESFEEMFND